MKDEAKKPADLKTRTKQFALRVMKMHGAIPKTEVGRIIGRQLLRSATSVGAHYRESIRARSNAEFISKLEGGMQELEESSYWMELLIEGNLVSEKKLAALLQEADELMAILVTMVRKVKSK